MKVIYVFFQLLYFNFFRQKTLKTEIMTQIINCTKIQSSKTFESKVLKYFPKSETKDIYIDIVGMRRNRNNGGAYENYLKIFIGRFNSLSFSHTHNDSVGWDNYSDWEAHNKKYQDWAKSTVLYLLAENKDKIAEYYEELTLETI